MDKMTDSRATEAQAQGGGEAVATIQRPGWPRKDSAVYFTMEHAAYDLPPGTPLYAAPPSAPVGVEDVVERLKDKIFPYHECPAESAAVWNTALYEMQRTLAQQPAAVDGACGDACAHIAIERDMLKANTEALQAEVERLKELVRSVGYEALTRAEQAEARAERLAEALIAWHKQATDKGRREREESPGHSHAVLGVWDSDNGKYAGVECAQCALWFEAARLRAALHPTAAQEEGRE